LRLPLQRPDDVAAFTIDYLKASQKRIVFGETMRAAFSASKRG